MSNVDLLQPYKLYFKGNWYVFDCQNRQFGALDEEDANKTLERLTKYYEERLSIKEKEALQALAGKD